MLITRPRSPRRVRVGPPPGTLKGTGAGTLGLLDLDSLEPGPARRLGVGSALLRGRWPLVSLVPQQFLLT